MNQSTPFTYLDDDTLASLDISTADVIASIEQALRALRQGALWAAPKASVLPGDGRYFMATLAAADNPQLVAVKTVMVSPRNSARGLPGINGAIMLLDSETGLLQAVLDANWVTAVRTAGLSAVVASRLANPQAASIAFVGCGVQARSHLSAFADLFPLQQVRAFGRGTSNIERLCSAAADRGLKTTVCDTAQQALDGADIVVSSITLAYDVEPFIDARWMKPGAFAAITDLAIPWIADGMTVFDNIIIDDIVQEQAMEKPMVDRSLVAGDMTQLVCGDISPAYSARLRGAFVFRGMAVGDFALASLAYSRAVN